jgi:hypothetical protein
MLVRTSTDGPYDRDAAEQGDEFTPPHWFSLKSPITSYHIGERSKIAAVLPQWVPIATGRGKLQIKPRPQYPVSDGRPEKGGLSRRANNRLTQRSK